MAAAPSTIETAEQQRQVPVPKKSAPFRLGTVGIISVLVIMLLVGSALFYLIAFQSRNNQLGTTSLNHSNTAVAQTRVSTPLPRSTPTIAVTPTIVPKNGLYIPGTYKGSMFDETTKQTT